ncbi:MAG: cytochrome P450 [Sporichthyaceae bacterium]
MPEPVVFNPFTPEFVEDPYPHYAELREADPVHAHPLGVWFLWRYADADELARSGLSVDERALPTSSLTPVYRELSGGKLPRGDGLALMDRDPPDHTRLRGLLTRTFTMRQIERLEPRVSQLVDEGFDRIAEAGSAELIGELAFPMPFTVVTELLGMPAEGSARVRELSDTIVMSMEPVTDPSVVAKIVAADLELTGMIAEAIAWKRGHLAEDLLSAMISASDAEGLLSEEELVAQTMVLFLAGHETTVNLLGNGTLALLRHPDQLALLRERPELAGNAVEELLRYDSPVQLGRRITTAPYEIDGRLVPAGTFVSPGIGAANRDPAKWGPDADLVRIERPDAREHLSFGAGIHHCLGAALARLEGRIYFTALANRFASVELDGQPRRNGLINLRGVAELPISVTPR